MQQVTQEGENIHGERCQAANDVANSQRIPADGKGPTEQADLEPSSMYR